MQLGLFALKNLGRTPLRTSLKVLSVALVTTIMLVWGSLNDGLELLLVKTVTAFEVGEFQLHAPGYLENPDLYTTLNKSEVLQAALKKQGFRVSPRLYSAALAAAGNFSAGTQVRALSLADEASVTEISHYVGSGDWLTPRQKDGVVIGKLLSKRLHVVPGHELILLGQAADGSLSNAVFKVQGVLKSVNSDIDNRALYMQANTFREFFLLPLGVHELAVARGDKTDDYAAVTKRLQKLASLGTHPAELKTWRQLKPVLAKVVDILRISANFIFVFIYAAMGGLLLNMMFMTIYDRLPEFGTMKALGMEPRQVVYLVLAEASWLAVFAGTFTLALGLPITVWYSHHGLDLSYFFHQYTVAGINLEPVIFAQVTFTNIFKPIIFMVASLVLFSLYPGLEVAAMPPIKALTSR